MKALELVNPARLFIEFSQDWLKAFNGTAGLQLALKREADGRLTAACKTEVVARLQGLIAHKTWQPRPRAFCAIGSRGVSLRRLSLPAASKEELQRLLPLQIESEFPLPPEQLAWGSQVLTGAGLQTGRPNDKQELLVAAVKKEQLEEYASLLAACGAVPVFTLTALAQSYVCPQPSCPYAVLGIDRNHSELISFEAGVPVSVRVLPLGGEQFAGAERGRSFVANPSAALLRTAESAATYGGAGPGPVRPGQIEGVEKLAQLLHGQVAGRRIYVLWTSTPAPGLDLAAQLGRQLGEGVDCLNVELALGQAGSAAILGLQRVVERPEGWPPLVLHAKQANGKAARIAQQAPLKLAAAALGLLVLALLLPYAEALTLKAHLAKKLAAIKSDQGRLATMDRELDFLQYLEQNQPPYLDALLVLAKAAPPGTRFDSVSMNRRGELAMRGSLRDGQQVAELRARLIDSGFFESVGIEEQSPSPDHQKVTVRMNAQWKPVVSRIKPVLEPGHAGESQHSSNRPISQPAFGPPPAGPNPAPPVKPIAPGKGSQ